MSTTLSVLLIANGIFNIVVWPAFLRRIVKDPRARDAAGKATTFLRVHVILIGIALALGLASIIVAIVALIGA